MEVMGKYGIRAKVLKKSRSAVNGAVFVTFEIEYPRLILAELNTHRDKSRNSASSRAIPFLKMLEQLTARPVRFGQANPGMQDKGEDYEKVVKAWIAGSEEDWWASAEDAWGVARDNAILAAKGFYEAGYHKQVYNRLVEPFQMMKTVISGTEWANFYWLRKDGAADPTIAELARVMWEADKGTDAQTLQPGQWHLPYIDTSRLEAAGLYYINEEDTEPAALEDAIKVSCARCAAVSFRNVDYTLEKSKEVYDRLVGDKRKHASAFEHCGTPTQETDYTSFVNVPQYPSTWEAGISHMDRQRNLWSGNLKSWIQYRKLIPGENYTGEY